MSIVEVTVLSRKSEPEPVWEAVSFPRWDDNPLQSIARRRCSRARSRALPVIDYLRCRFACCQRCADSLDLRCLLSETGSQRCDFLLLLRDCPVELFLLLRDRCFLLLDLAMGFEEFIEQHRVHCFVANRVRLAVVIARDQ